MSRISKATVGLARQLRDGLAKQGHLAGHAARKPIVIVAFYYGGYRAATRDLFQSARIEVTVSNGMIRSRRHCSMTQTKSSNALPSRRLRLKGGAIIAPIHQCSKTAVGFGFLEFPARLVIGRHGTGADVIDPAMQGKIALFQSSRNRGMRAQVFHLCDYIIFSQREKKFGARFRFAVLHFA